MSTRSSSPCSARTGLSSSFSFARKTRRSSPASQKSATPARARGSPKKTPAGPNASSPAGKEKRGRGSKGRATRSSAPAVVSRLKETPPATLPPAQEKQAKKKPKHPKKG